MSLYFFRLIQPPSITDSLFPRILFSTVDYQSLCHKRHLTSEDYRAIILIYFFQSSKYLDYASIHSFIYDMIISSVFLRSFSYENLPIKI